MAKRITKKEIATALRTLNATEIFKVAVKYGIDVSNRMNLLEFIRYYAPSQKVYNKAYQLSYGAGDFKNIRNDHKSGLSTLAKVIAWAKFEKKQGKSNYSKVLITGNTNIYWASPIYGHSDYNKSIAMPLNDKNLKAMKVINNFLGA